MPPSPPARSTGASSTASGRAATLAERCRSFRTSPTRSKSRVYAMDDGETDVCITEIGGTVGDIESQPFLEAIRQVAAEKGRGNVLFIHVPLIVSIPGSGELKSKAHAAFRQGAALPRHPAGYPRLPHGQPAARRCAP